MQAGAGLRVVLITAPDEAVAERLARGLVEERLAACVSRVAGLRSTYRWEGRIEDEAEVLLVVKTRRERLGDLAAWLAEHHPYDVPELVAFEPAEVGAVYGAWLRTNC